jgi:hypothetical protein
MSETGLSQRAVAALAGTKQPAVLRAARRGLLDLTASGKIDPDGARTRTWIESHASKSIKPSIAAVDVTDARLAEKTAALQNREYDLLLWRSNATERSELAAVMHLEADQVDAILKAYPAEMTRQLNDVMEHPSPKLGLSITAAMATFLLLRGDQHEKIDKALDHQAARWDQHPPRLMRKKPAMPAFTPPKTIAEADYRLSVTRGAIATTKIRGRAGELLAEWPAHTALASMRIAWWQEAHEDFDNRHGAQLFAAAGFNISRSLQWAFMILTAEVMSKLFWEPFHGITAWRDIVRRPQDKYLADALDALRTARAEGEIAA